MADVTTYLYTKLKVLTDTNLNTKLLPSASLNVCPRFLSPLEIPI